MTRLKQAFWKAVIWVAFRMLEAAGAKPRRPKKVFDLFDHDFRRGLIFADVMDALRLQYMLVRGRP